MKIIESTVEHKAKSGTASENIPVAKLKYR